MGGTHVSKNDGCGQGKLTFRVAVRFAAPLVLDGAIDGEAFLARTQRFLVNELKPGDRLLDRFTPDECANDIRHRGFAQSTE